MTVMCEGILLFERYRAKEKNI